MATTFTHNLNARMGRKIEIVYKEDAPDKVERVIKNNRGTVKDTLEFDAVNFIERVNTIERMYKIFKKEGWMPE